MRKVSLLELGENSMAHAMLMFLMADLRTLSATGKIRTKFEHLCLDNDMPRTSARDFTGGAIPLEAHDESKNTNTDDNTTEDASDSEPNPPTTRGVTSAHIMAVLLLEITRESKELKQNNIGSKKFRKKKSALLEDDEQPRPFTLNRDDIQLAGAMPALLHCYNDMIASDISPEVHMVSKQQWPLDPPPMEHFNGAQSPQFGRSDFEPDVVDDDDEHLFPSFDVLFEEYFGWPRPTLRWNEHNNDFRTHHSLAELADLHDHVFNNNGVEVGDVYYNNDELVELIEQAIETRDFARLGFLNDFFKEGSLSSVVLQSQAEIVWLSDWHATHELMYAISVDKEKKQVNLAFRGAKSKSDSVRAYDMNFTSTSNPIQEPYPDRPMNIKIRSRFHKYLFRVRKDTGSTKYDEINAKLEYYCNQVGPDATIIMSGHSIGAALATLVAFYASTEERFTRRGAIEVVTFGCPYIGGYKLADAIRFQETSHKLRIARFHNARDGVAHLPPTLFSISKRGATYFNNGMDIRLPMVRKGVFKIFGQPQPRVRYNARRPFLMSVGQQVKDYYFFNLPVRLWLKSKMHPLVEHKNRMQLVKRLKDPESSPLVRYSLEELYEMRQELK